MTKYREILRLYTLKFSERNIALSCSVSRSTVSKVIKVADEKLSFGRLMNLRLLIIDEWLLIKLIEQEVRNLFEVISKRRKRSSTIFCSRFLEEGWYNQLGVEGTLADAIMDRISYNSYKINIVSIDPSKDISMREVYGLDHA